MSTAWLAEFELAGERFVWDDGLADYVLVDPDNDTQGDSYSAIA